MRKILLVAFVVMGLAGGAAAEEKTCGQHISEMAVLPAKMSEVMTAVANMMDTHATLMLQDKSKPSKQEAAALKKLAAQHKKLAAEFKKTQEMMEKASTWPNAPHDMNKMMNDSASKTAMAEMLRTHKEFDALLNKQIAELEAMTKGGGHAGH